MTDRTAVKWIILGIKFLNLVFINLIKNRIKINKPKATNRSPTEKGIQPKIILKKDEITG